VTTPPPAPTSDRPTATGQARGPETTVTDREGRRPPVVVTTRPANGSTLEGDDGPALEARDVHLWYGQVEALKGITMPMTRHRITALIGERYTIVIVTHNLQQAARISDSTAFFMLGQLIEHSPTLTMFTAPRERVTEEYVTGRFG
jgi:ABC-type histidine transport system ATPase subunit